MKKQILTISLLSTIIVHGQNPYWRAGGNTNAGIDAVNIGNNIFGTQAANNTAIRFQTTGTDRMYMNPRSAGFVILRNA